MPPVLDDANRVSMKAAALHFDQIFAGDDVASICEAILQAAGLMKDWEWVFVRVQSMLERPDPGIRIGAMKGLGHLVRENEKLDLDAAEEMVGMWLESEDLALREQCEQVKGYILEARLHHRKLGF
ncbi:hypothetical protein [Aestuariispira insulae]|uniref:hypothetical protein n=1 Tax=Aestuariispira insulae TaxID=1461337 RepID=UPI000E227E29|nr:hypothetical protein [Aestuariispira insulae]